MSDTKTTPPPAPAAGSENFPMTRRCSICGYEQKDEQPSYPRCPVCNPGEWWTRHASLLAEKMRRGGVRLFRIEMTPRGTYVFEVDPVATNAKQSDQP